MVLAMPLWGRGPSRSSYSRATAEAAAWSVGAAESHWAAELAAAEGAITDAARMPHAQPAADRAGCTVPGVEAVPVTPGTAVEDQRPGHAFDNEGRRTIVVGVTGINRLLHGVRRRVARLRVGTRRRVRGRSGWRCHDATGQRQQQSGERETVTHWASSSGTNLHSSPKH